MPKPATRSVPPSRSGGGFLLGMFLYILGYMIIHGKLHWRLSLYVAGGTVLACWLVFDYLLKIGLYGGLLLEG